MITTVDSSTTVVLERDPGEPDCEVCSVDGSTRSCSPTEKMLSNAVNLTLEFSCLAPQNVFSAKITKHIGERFARLSGTGRRFPLISRLFYISGLFCCSQNEIFL